MVRVIHLEKDKTFDKIEWRNIDGTGVNVRFKGESPSDEAIRHGELEIDRGQWVITAANNLEEALEKFHTLEGAKTGSSSQEDFRALWIRSDLPIVELPVCPYLHNSPLAMNFCEAKRNDGTVVEKCILGDGKDPPKCCPVEPVLAEAKINRPQRVSVRGRMYSVYSQDFLE